MNARTRRARFSAVVKGKEWRFVWEPKTGRLTAWRKRTRKSKCLTATAEHLVELMQGQLMLL
jgi:hypothetical protein